MARQNGEAGEALASRITDSFRALEKVDFVNFQIDDNYNTVTITVLVDMPEYDDDLRDALLDIELDWTEKIEGDGTEILYIYLPSSYVEPETQLSSVELENLL